METIVFTNGCFDIIHPGHIDLLKQARNLGTKLIVGINSDRSVREIKGSLRPLLNQESRAAVLRELRSVDEVRIFDENTPDILIREINPHILVKGGDWKTDQIVGADFVLENGGRVFSIPFKQNISTTQIVKKVQAGGNADPVPGAAADILEMIRLPSAESDIKRGAEIIADVLSKEKKIWITSFSEHTNEAVRLADDLKRYFGEEKVLLLQTTESFDCFETFPGHGDLLIAVTDKREREEHAGILMKARQRDCRTLLMAENNKKLAALSDVCVMLQANSLAERIWKLETIGYLWFRVIKLQANAFNF